MASWTSAEVGTVLATMVLADADGVLVAAAFVLVVAGAAAVLRLVVDEVATGPAGRVVEGLVGVAAREVGLDDEAWLALDPAVAGEDLAAVDGDVAAGVVATGFGWVTTEAWRLAAILLAFDRLELATTPMPMTAKTMITSPPQMAPNVRDFCVRLTFHAPFLLVG